MHDQSIPILATYAPPAELTDRFATEPQDALDVLIAVRHTNELWRQNLHALYREIPVNRLVIGDLGNIDGAIDIARGFPRVTVFDHSEYYSVGYSVGQLIAAVETEYFLLLQPDVYLPSGWYADAMEHLPDAALIASRNHRTALVDYPEQSCTGAQIGRRVAFERIHPLIEDDYLYYDVDEALKKIVERAGFIAKDVPDIIHYRQLMQPVKAWRQRIKSVKIEEYISLEERMHLYFNRCRANIKYLSPTHDRINVVRFDLQRLNELGLLSWQELQAWVAQTNPVWWNYIKSGPAKGKPAPAKGKPAPAKGKPAPAKGKPAPAKAKPAPAKAKRNVIGDFVSRVRLRYLALMVFLTGMLTGIGGTLFWLYQRQEGEIGGLHGLWSLLQTWHASRLGRSSTPNLKDG